MAGSLPIRPLATGPFWVSPSGSDTTGTGSQANPWRQIQKAADYIRENKLNLVMSADITINVLAGSYSPVALGTLDSGFNGHRVRYVSSDGVGLAIIDAGVRITNWVQVSGTHYKASVPNVFWTVYENGVRSTLARLPKRVYDPDFPQSRQPYFASAADPNVLTRVQYDPLDVDPSGWVASDVSVSGYSGGSWQWFGDTNPVSSIDTVNKWLNLANEAKFNWYQFNTSSRYYVQGDLSMLSDPGEWYLDRGAMELHYIARDGDIHDQVIVIPAASEALTMTGLSWKAGERVTSVTFDGFTIANTDHVQWYRPGWPVPNAGTVNMPVPTPWLVAPLYSWFTIMPQNKLAAVHLRNVDHVELTNVHVTDAGMYGILLDEYASNNTFTKFQVNGVGLAGVRLEGQFPSLGDIVRDNTFDDFKIFDVGELSSQGNFQIANSGHNHLSHFELYNSPRQGIWVLGPNGVSTASQVYVRDNLIEYGRIHNVGQDGIDQGALGFDSFSSSTTTSDPAINTAQQLLIYDIHVASSAVPYSFAPNGVFCDDLTGNAPDQGQVLSNIWTTNTQANGFRKNNSDGHQLTNCSFLVDGSVNPSFNSALVDVPNIGTTSTFPAFPVFP